jgi:hypothetical protein
MVATLPLQCPEDGNSKLFRNADNKLQVNMVPYPQKTANLIHTAVNVSHRMNLPS